jgi:hypothetical protein
MLVQFEMRIVPFFLSGCISRSARGSRIVCSHRAKCSSQATLAQLILKLEWVPKPDHQRAGSLGSGTGS